MGLAFVFKHNGFIVMTNRNRRRYGNTVTINGKQRRIPGKYIPPNEFSCYSLPPQFIAAVSWGAKEGAVSWMDYKWPCTVGP